MSHSDETIVCPNCGAQAKGNYCYQCGQETHLHNDTFWGLLMHFLGHYFHYDSKFWQTLKALWFSPGKLTIAYKEKQRMRYLPPISLYIFISAMYFLLSFSVADGLLSTSGKKDKKHKTAGTTKYTSSGNADSALVDSLGKFRDSAEVLGFMSDKALKIRKEHGNFNHFLRERVAHDFPKFFFFMIPLMGLVLRIMYLRRKNSGFVDHTIFALHYQSFWFSVLTLHLIPLHGGIEAIFLTGIFISAAVYMVVALHNVYNTGWLRAFFYSLIIAFWYGIMLLIVLMADFFLILLTA